MYINVNFINLINDFALTMCAFVGIGGQPGIFGNPGAPGIPGVDGCNGTDGKRSNLNAFFRWNDEIGWNNLKYYIHRYDREQRKLGVD